MQIDPVQLDMLGISPRESNRLIATFSLIPDDVRTALEIGFYDLRITRLLRQQLSLTSIDLPRVLDFDDRTGLVFASVTALPFSGRRFDLVLCTEVLEHLSTESVCVAASELVRATGRYLLVSVPYRQQIASDLFKCNECGYVGNTMGHLQAFDEARLKDLFAQMQLLRTELIGSTNGRAPGWLYRLSRSVGNVWYDYAFGQCPSCKRTNKALRENRFGYLLRRILWRIERRMKPQPAWIAMLFELKKGATNERGALSSSPS